MKVRSTVHQDKKTKLNNIKVKADNAPDNNVHFAEYTKDCSNEQKPILSNHLCKHQTILDAPQFNPNVTLESQLKEKNKNKAMILTISDKTEQAPQVNTIHMKIDSTSSTYSKIPSNRTTTSRHNNNCIFKRIPVSKEKKIQWK